MKTKLLLAIIFVFSIFSSFAQENFAKKSVLLGGNFGFSQSKSELGGQETNNNSGFSIFPVAGIAVRDNLFIGLSLGFSHQRYFTNPGNNIDSAKFSSYSYGLFLRKYKPLKYKFSIFLQADLDGSNSDYKYNSNSQVYQSVVKGFGVNASLSPGISYSINSKLQIEAALNNIFSVGYSQTKNTYPTNAANASKISQFNISTSLNNFTSQLTFGFRFLLQNNKTGKS